jgi:hypothetical protein
MSIFGCLTYRNLRRTIVLREQQANRQLVKMILPQVILVLISATPYMINGLYNAVTNGIIKSPDRQEKEYFAAVIVIMLAFFCFTVYFYRSSV